MDGVHSTVRESTQQSIHPQKALAAVNGSRETETSTPSRDDIQSKGDEGSHNNNGTPSGVEPQIGSEPTTTSDVHNGMGSHGELDSHKGLEPHDPIESPNGTRPKNGIRNKLLEQVVRTPGRMPSPQPTHLSVAPSGLPRVLYEEGPGYVAPKFEGKESQMDQGGFWIPAA